MMLSSALGSLIIPLSYKKYLTTLMNSLSQTLVDSHPDDASNLQRQIKHEVCFRHFLQELAAEINYKFTSSLKCRSKQSWWTKPNCTVHWSLPLIRSSVYSIRFSRFSWTFGLVRNLVSLESIAQTPDRRLSSRLILEPLVGWNYYEIFTQCLVKISRR